MVYSFSTNSSRLHLPDGFSDAIMLSSIKILNCLLPVSLPQNLSRRIKSEYPSVFSLYEKKPPFEASRQGSPLKFPATDDFASIK